MPLEKKQRGLDRDKHANKLAQWSFHIFWLNKYAANSLWSVSDGRRIVDKERHKLNCGLVFNFKLI
jgi:hypothetical protein